MKHTVWDRDGKEGGVVGWGGGGYTSDYITSLQADNIHSDSRGASLMT